MEVDRGALTHEYMQIYVQLPHITPPSTVTLHSPQSPPILPASQELRVGSAHCQARSNPQDWQLFFWGTVGNTGAGSVKKPRSASCQVGPSALRHGQGGPFLQTPGLHSHPPLASGAPHQFSEMSLTLTALVNLGLTRIYELLNCWRHARRREVFCHLSSTPAVASHTTFSSLQNSSSEAEQWQEQLSGECLESPQPLRDKWDDVWRPQVERWQSPL